MRQNGEMVFQTSRSNDLDVKIEKKLNMVYALRDNKVGGRCYTGTKFTVLRKVLSRRFNLTKSKRKNFKMAILAS